MPFTLPINFATQLNTPFNQAVSRVEESTITEFTKAQHWLDLFPYSEFKADLQLSFATGAGFRGKSEREQRLE